MRKTLKHKKEISSLFDKGKTIVGKYVLIKYKDSEDPKYLVTTSQKKYKRAVDRNRIKRLLRESLKDITLTKDVAIVYINNSIGKFGDIKSEIIKLLNRI